MNTSTTRRGFSVALFGGAGLAALGLQPARAGDPPEPAAPADWPGFPHQPPDLVRATVGAAHTDLEKVRSLVEAHPALANAAWDWGFGDWETALGAASHTGQRAIAEYLIGRGARPDLFTAAMLGQTDTVRSLLAALPGAQRIRGPHGISLLSHAEAGGERAAALAAYLKELGDANAAPSAALPGPVRDRCVGEYAYGPGPAERFTIKVQRERLAFQKGEEPPRFLVYLAEHRFHPVGAPGVQVVFTVENDRCTGAVITDHDLRIAGNRV